MAYPRRNTCTGMISLMILVNMLILVFVDWTWLASCHSLDIQLNTFAALVFIGFSYQLHKLPWLCISSPWTCTLKNRCLWTFSVIRNIATKVASMFTRTCRLSWRHLDCRDVIKICGQLWSQMQPYMKFWASFSKIYRFQQAKPIRKLTIQIGLACLNRKI